MRQKGKGVKQEFSSEQIARALHEIYPDTGVVLLTTSHDPGSFDSDAFRFEITDVGVFRITNALSVEKVEGAILRTNEVALDIRDQLAKHFTPVAIDVRADYLKALAAFTAPEDIRYYLTGIHVRPHHEKGVIIEATDGHSAGIIHDESGVCNKPAILKIDADMIRKIRAGHRYVVENGTGTLKSQDAQALFIVPGNPLIDAKFPDIPKLLRDKEFAPGLMQCVNWEYIERCKVKPLLSGYKLPALKFWHQRGDGIDPNHGMIVVRNDMAPEFMALVMPIRDSLCKPVPAWFAPKAE